ncbi:acetyltransferase [Pseudomonas sp. B5(2017)]|uniref:acetyltransferase n=1 Tax=Pseudomonas sp. B5(2017) TaxID=1981714 RepID=UPI000A1FB66B|nr:acetyltransferase [Pseudomonas sp. B5(2017)]
MTRIYAFNGDADGLCALQQLRLAEPGEALLVTGIKRDIKLLERVQAYRGDEVIALDISLDSNREGLLSLLERGVSVRYFDHHFAGELPNLPHFAACIDIATDVCSSILVDRYLKARHHPWAIVAAYGDSLRKVAEGMAVQAGYDQQHCQRLEKLGIYLNYNAYGERLEDLHFDPAALAEAMLPYQDPLAFMQESDVFAALSAGYEQDMALARQLQPLRQGAASMVVMLPDQAWARRAIGVLANELMLAHPGHAVAILSPRFSGGYTVSLRVPADSPLAADEFCRRFPTGGGRRGAAGINLLSESSLDCFISQFETEFTAP